MLPRQKIQDYYTEFKNIPVTFNKEIIQVTGLQPKQVILKCASDFFPCFVYSTSFVEARIVAGNKSGLLEKLKETNNSASIKFCFKIPASGEQVVFLVAARVTGSNPYDATSDMSMFTLQFSQHPPDDLIEIVGRILEANINFSKRKDERIVISSDTLRKLRFSGKEIGVTIEDVPRRCILRDISFTGAHIVMLGISKFLIGKRASIKFDFTEPDENYSIDGKIEEAEKIAERKDMIIANVAYNSPVPMVYKVRLSDYFSTVRIDAKTGSPIPAADAAASPADDQQV
jgi:hypothetical protein